MRVGKNRKQNKGLKVKSIIATTRKKSYIERILSNKRSSMKIAKIDLPSRVVLSPVFSTKEQEKMFSECAKKSVSTIAELKW